MNNLPVLYKPYKIYLHISPSGGVYVGQTKQDVKRRFSGGCGYKGSHKLYNVIKTYGWDNIEHVVLLDCLTKEEADKYEKGLIKAFRSVGECYNINEGGSGNVGHIVSEELRALLSEKFKGIHRSAKTEFKKGYKISEETIEKRRLKMIGKPSGMKGKHHSAESKKRISNINKKPIIQYSKSGDYIKEWDSATDVSKILNIDSSSISACCRGKRYTAGGFKWKYKGE